MATFWDERFSSEEYIYGTEPNAFLKQELEKLQNGSLLLPAEGEGRNAAFAAGLGWNVFAFDTSVEGRKKALKLAEQRKVSYSYEYHSVFDFPYSEKQFDAVALIYFHMQSNQKREFFSNLLTAIKPGGSLIMEVFSKDQLNYGTGGPQEEDLLFSMEEMKEYLTGISFYVFSEEEITFHEGEYHKGKAKVIRVSGRKL